MILLLREIAVKKWNCCPDFLIIYYINPGFPDLPNEVGAKPRKH